MKQTWLAVAVALSLSCAVKTARAEDTYVEGTPVENTTEDSVAKTTRKVPKTPVKVEKSQTERATNPNTREVASGRSEEIAVSRENREWSLRADLFTGVSSAASSNTREQNTRDAGTFDRNIYFGLNGDFQYGQNLGAGLDTFFGMGSTANVGVTDPLVGNTDTRARKLSQFGLLVDAQGRYTLDHWGRKWNFRGGLGYGIANVKQDNPGFSSSATASKFQVNSPYATVGVEVRVIPQVSINTDYAISFAASGNQEVTTALGATSTALDSPRFDRIRIMAAYELTPQYLVGLAFIRRQLRGTVTGGTGVTSETMHQFLASFSVVL